MPSDRLQRFEQLMDYSVQVTPSTHDSVMRTVGYIADVVAHLRVDYLDSIE